jgi:hypothetical protein
MKILISDSLAQRGVDLLRESLSSKWSSNLGFPRKSLGVLLAMLRHSLSEVVPR